MPASSEAANLVVFQNSQGIQIQATVLKLTRHLVILEIYSPFTVLRVSEVLTDFKILLNEVPVYSGRAVISNLISTGTITICEAALEESWLDVDLSSLLAPGKDLQAGFKGFIERWGKLYKILPEYKLVTTDLETFFMDLRNWLEQVELGIRALPSTDRQQAERDILQTLMPAATPAFKSMFERFEECAARIETDAKAAHAVFCRRHLHAHLLSSPFMHRIYTKPLGYAGDYEMVNMILRDPIEGSSVFAKVLNMFILCQTPAVAHRNRVNYLTEKLKAETLRTIQNQDLARIFNVGCGPAKEVQDFLATEELSQQADFTLLDFNEETLRYAAAALEEAKRKYGRATPIRFIQKSIQNLLKQRGQGKRPPGQQYDFIYCAGLFDYLTDRVSKYLLDLLYEWLSPGGLLVATNVEHSNPIRNIMEYMFEWYLVYRNASQLRSLAPDQAPTDNVRVLAEGTGTNLFLEIRKPLADS